MNIGKILKRKVSRVAFEAPDPSQLSLAETNSSSPSAYSTSAQPSSAQYEYQRPDFLGSLTEHDMQNFSNHMTRHVLTPRTRLPDGVGYAEAINAGKSKYNEDQATIIEGSMTGLNGVTIPYLFLGLFDGHGGYGAGLKIAHELHEIVREGLEDALPYITNPDKLETPEERKDKNTVAAFDHNHDEEADFEDETVELKMTIDELINGALESSFWAMDRKILMDKEKYKITGGATCLVALFICGKLYVANAGDSRAGVFKKDGQIVTMSSDHTPMADRQRIQEIAFHRPELIRHPQTREKLFNRHILARKVTKEDIGISVLYQDFYMTGWSVRDVTSDDVNLIQIISGRGKQCRILGTVGVARSLGDHDLLAKGCGIRVKEFLTPQPELKVLDKLEDKAYSGAVLVMGSDGLWDVMSNESVQDIVSEGLENSLNPEALAKRLVERARGERMPDHYWVTSENKLASGDDITAIVVFLDQAKKE